MLFTWILNLRRVMANFLTLSRSFFSLSSRFVFFLLYLFSSSVTLLSIVFNITTCEIFNMFFTCMLLYEKRAPILLCTKKNLSKVTEPWLQYLYPTKRHLFLTPWSLHSLFHLSFFPVSTPLFSHFFYEYVKLSFLMIIDQRIRFPVLFYSARRPVIASPFGSQAP